MCIIFEVYFLCTVHHWSSAILWLHYVAYPSPTTTIPSSLTLHACLHAYTVWTRFDGHIIMSPWYDCPLLALLFVLCFFSLALKNGPLLSAHRHWKHVRRHSPHLLLSLGCVYVTCRLSSSLIIWLLLALYLSSQHVLYMPLALLWWPILSTWDQL